MLRLLLPSCVFICLGYEWGELETERGRKRRNGPLLFTSLESTSQHCQRPSPKVSSALEKLPFSKLA
jgi:hypothetical protein